MFHGTVKPTGLARAIVAPLLLLSSSARAL
jgi:hypothetical protein